MKQFINLLKISLNVNFGISALRYRFTKERKRLWEPVLIFLSIIVGGGSITAFYTMILQNVYMVGLVLNSPEIVIIVSLIIGQFTVFVFGIMYIISAFYFSNDINILVPLPLKPYQVLGCKFITIMINEYLILLPLLVPSIIIYGTGIKPGIAYWFKSVFIILLSPVIPLIIASVFVLILMRLVNIRKSKDLLIVIGTLFGVLLSLTVNYYTQKMPDGDPGQFVQNLVSSRIDIIEMIGEKFPHVIWSTYSLSKTGLEGFIYFGLTIIVFILAFAFLLWLGNQIFYRGLLSGQEVSSRKKRLSPEQINRKTQGASSPVTALFRREWKLFIRTPIYALNGLAGMIMVPFILLMPVFTRGEEMQDAISLIRQPQFIAHATLGSFGLILFTASVNIVACTSISREGQTFCISKMILVAPKHQVAAKLLHGMSISAIGIAVTLALVAIVLQLPLLRLLIVLILGLLGNLLLNILNLIIDVIRPKLEWNNPQEAVKQNLNGFFSILLTMVSLGCLAGLSVFLFDMGLSEWWIYIILGVIAGILSLLSLKVLFTLAEKAYKKLEI